MNEDKSNFEPKDSTELEEIKGQLELENVDSIGESIECSRR